MAGLQFLINSPAVRKFDLNLESQIEKYKNVSYDEMHVGNLARLREAANNLLASVGNNESIAEVLKPHLDNILFQLEKVSSFQCTHITPQSSTSNYDAIGYGFTLDEKQRIAIRMNGFDYKENHVWDEIVKRFGSNIKRGELTNIAQLLADTAGIKLDRDAKRRKSVLLKWFDEHWEKVLPLLDYVVLSDNEDAVLSENETTNDLFDFVETK